MIIRMKQLALGLLCLTGLVPTAQAGISHQWFEVNIPSGAIANDPALATKRTWDLKITTTGGDDWLSTSISATLNGAATFYQSGFQSANGTAPNQAFLGVAPALDFDSFAAAGLGPVAAATASTRGGYSSSPITILSGNQTSPPASVFQMDYGDLANGGDSTWTVARLTFDANANGTITGNIQSQLRQNSALPKVDISAPIVNGAVVPEPATLSIVGVGGLLLLRRRRTV